MARPTQSRARRSRRAGWVLSVRRLVFILPLLGPALAFAKCSPPDTRVTPAAAGVDSTRTVLASTPVAPGASRSLELAIGECDGAGCPLEIRLVDAGGTVDVERLEWTVATAASQEGPVGPTAGVGDPLAGEVVAWTNGEEERMSTVAGRAARLAPDRTAMLVDLSAGFEHPKRRHELWIADADSLRRVWLGTEPQGPSWSTVAIAPSADGAYDTLIYFDGYSAGQPGDPDVLRAARLVWREESRALDAVPAGSSVYAVLVDSYESAAQAWEARNGAADCLSSYWVLSAAELGLTDHGPVVLAALTASDSLANAELERIAGCSGTADASLVQLSGRD